MDSVDKMAADADTFAGHLGSVPSMSVRFIMCMFVSCIAMWGEEIRLSPTLLTTVCRAATKYPLDESAHHHLSPFQRLKMIPSSVSIS